MSTPLRVLLVDDSEDDALLLLRVLRNGGYEPIWERTDTAAGLRDALDRERWDVIFCDSTMLKFSGLGALKLLESSGRDIPVIVVSDQVGEEFAVDVMKAGARDYVRKDNLSRLVPVVQRELRESLGRHARQQAESALGTSRARIQDLVEGLDAIIWEAEAISLQFLYVSPRAEHLLGYPVAQWLDDPNFWANHVHPDDRERAVTSCRAAIDAGRDHTLEYRFIAADGRAVWLRDIVRVVCDDQGRPERVRGVMVDITGRRQAEEEKAALLDLAREIGGTLEINEILDLGQRRAARLLSCDRVATFYRDKTGGVFRLIAQYGIPDEQRAAAADVEFAAGQPIVDHALRGETVLINDVRAQEWLPAASLATLGLSAVVCVPMVIRGQILGVMVAGLSGCGRRFESRQVQLFEGIGRQVALALSAAEMYRARQEEALVSAALAQVGQDLIQSMDRPALLDRVCALTSTALHCDCSHTVLWDARQHAYAIVSGYGDSPEQKEAFRVLRIPADVVGGLIERLRDEAVVQVVMGEPQGLIPDGFSQQYGITAGMYVALWRGQELIGVQTAGYRGRRVGFAEYQERIFRGIAQLASLALENARVMEELERANRLKYDFVATMSHELRSPLNVIMGYGDLLLHGEFGPLSSEQMHITKRIDRSARELLELINATLDLSRLDGGQLPVQRSETRLTELLRTFDAEMQEVQQKPGVRFTWQIPARLPAMQTDPLKLKVIMKNLVANAAKFTDQGSVAITAVARRDGVEITVSDTGIGIPSDAQELIFEPFRQLDGSASRRHGGVGLGLYIARRLVELLEGTISVESQVGHGSTFRVWLPTAPSL